MSASVKPAGSPSARLHLVERLLHGRHARPVAALRGEPRDARLDHAPHLVGLAQPRQARAHRVAVDPLQRLAVQRLGAGDLALLGEDQPGGRELAQRLARDRLRHAELAGDLALGRQRLAGRDAAVEQRRGDGVRHRDRRAATGIAGLAANSGFLSG